MKIFILMISLILVLINGLAAQSTELIFSHQFHLEDVEAECTDCHAPVLESMQPADDLLPSMETCYNCHSEDETECTVCHSNPDEAVAVPRTRNYKAGFPHKLHAKSSEDCLTCHPGMVQRSAVAGKDNVPDNALCVNCHQPSDYAENPNVCQTCHAPEMDLKPTSHQPGWIKQHGMVTTMDDASCNHCHQQNSCIQCHEGDNLDHVVHGLNFRSTHGLKARANKDNCLTCHQEQAFCIECHNNELVMPRNHSLANWSNTSNGGRHARTARSDFDTCMSCHNDAYNDVVCVSCHGL